MRSVITPFDSPHTGKPSMFLDLYKIPHITRLFHFEKKYTCHINYIAVIASRSVKQWK